MFFKKKQSASVNLLISLHIQTEAVTYWQPFIGMYTSYNVKMKAKWNNLHFRYKIERGKSILFSIRFYFFINISNDTQFNSF